MKIVTIGNNGDNEVLKTILAPRFFKELLFPFFVTTAIDSPVPFSQQSLNYLKRTWVGGTFVNAISGKPYWF